MLNPPQHQKSIARQHLLGSEKKVQEKEESIQLARRILDEEHLQRQKELEKEMQDIPGELSIKSDVKYKFNKQAEALDEEFVLSKTFIAKQSKSTGAKAAITSYRKTRSWQRNVETANNSLDSNLQR